MNPKRYIRQTSLKDFGPEAQKRLFQSKVLVVGAGGLGIPVLQYLTSMGVGTIGIVENDVVDITNLQRQVIYKESDVGHPKIYAVINRLKDLNSEVNFIPYKTYLTQENALNIIEDFDVVVDASDNFPTRYLINDACIILSTPFVYGALHSFEGQVSVFNYKNGPTYRCLFPEIPNVNEIPDCNENGVLGIIPSIIGSLQALEVVKVLTEIGEVLAGRLLLYDGLRQEFQNLKFELIKKNKSINSLQDDYGSPLCNLETSVSANEFLSITNTDGNLKILDVRTKVEFREGHLEKACNIPIQNFETETRSLKEFQGGKSSVYVICQSGQRSKRAIHYLKKLYPDSNFINVEGGYNALDIKFNSKNKIVD